MVVHNHKKFKKDYDFRGSRLPPLHFEICKKSTYLDKKAFFKLHLYEQKTKHMDIELNIYPTSAFSTTSLGILFLPFLIHIVVHIS